MGDLIIKFADPAGAMNICVLLVSRGFSFRHKNKEYIIVRGAHHPVPLKWWIEDEMKKKKLFVDIVIVNTRSKPVI